MKYRANFILVLFRLIARNENCSLLLESKREQLGIMRRFGNRNFGALFCWGDKFMVLLVLSLGQYEGLLARDRVLWTKIYSTLLQSCLTKYGRVESEIFEN